MRNLATMRGTGAMLIDLCTVDEELLSQLVQIFPGIASAEVIRT